ncbi:hypothetical protein J4732_23060 [Serratia marcescens]|uniref:D-isomer specific 2-hydroxyacid dehydrogenase NAD-binding domain-containing protein n=1 Tax=Serratia marcescens TaxID=615 RepID=A0A939SRK6_SERMA|nr:hypothetical protein [Serratia marcescens]
MRGTSSGSAAPMELTRRCCSGWRSISCRKASGCKNNGPWQRDPRRHPAGENAGAAGAGQDRRPDGPVAQAFGMRVLARARTDGGTGGAGGKPCWRRPSGRCSSRATLSPSTGAERRSRGLVGRDELTAMKPTAYLINTSRAAIVDRAALVDVLQQRKIAGAGLDVFETEPLPADDAFRQLPNVLATPHVGYVADDNYRAYFTEAVEDIAAFLAGQPIRRLG